jgi:molybdopterin synthase catalytic subunit
MENTSAPKKTKKIFIDGPIKPDFIAESIGKHSTKKDIGGHNIFLGQVRNDIIEGKKVIAIDYTAYQEMAEKEINNIREDVFENFDLTCLHIYHSIGRVNAGEISLFVFASSQHRDECYAASRYIVEEVKSRVPIFGKEVLEDGSHVWKEN